MKTNYLNDWKKGVSRYFMYWKNETSLSFFGVNKYSEELYFVDRWEAESKPVTVRLKNGAVSFSRGKIRFDSQEAKADDMEKLLNAATKEIQPDYYQSLVKRFSCHCTDLLEIGARGKIYHEYKQEKLF